jgi:four helix bundle protein
MVWVAILSFKLLAFSCELWATSCKLQASSFKFKIGQVTMRDFKKLLIWQKAMELVVAVYKSVEKFPKEEKYGLRSQVTRCAVSIAANIAEGSAKSSQKEYRYYSEIALGSSFELETHILIVEKLEWLLQKEIKELLKLVAEEQRMLSSFINKLKE